MATHKANRSSTKTKAVPYRRVRTFPQAKGKTIEKIELSVSSDEYTIDVRFQDKTALSFDFESSVSVTPELANWKSGSYKPLKRWRPVHSS
jgi:hypothetical protein